VADISGPGGNSIYKFDAQGNPTLFTSTGLDEVAALVTDSSGDIYGTAPSGGEYGNGVLFEITP